MAVAVMAKQPNLAQTMSEMGRGAACEGLDRAAEQAHCTTALP